MKNNLTLIDGNSLLFRAFYGVGSHLTRRDGTPVNAVYGFCNMVLPLLVDAGPEDIFICVFDAHRRNWRNDIYPHYKANRGDTPPELVAQFQLTRDAAAAFGMPVLVIDDVEADDVIATLAKHECALNRKTRIVTGDKDLMQLVSHCVFLYDGMKEKEIHEPEVFEKFGVKPDQVIDAQSLIGDATDNIPGVPGIGPKTAAELINQFGSLDNIYKNIDAVSKERIKNLLTEHKDMAYMSRQLVALKDDVKLPKFSDAPFHFDVAHALEFVTTQVESTSLANKIRKMFETHEIVPAKQGEKIITKTMPHHERKGKPYKLIDSESELDAFLAGVEDILAFDTETTGLNQMTARVVGISLATKPDFGVYIPIRHATKSHDLFGDDKSAISNQQSAISLDAVKRKLWPVFKNHHVTKIGHNLKYDLHILENEGWNTDEIAPIDDTMLLSYALYGTNHGHGLDELAKLYLDHDNIPFDSLFPPRTRDADKDFSHVDPERAAEYSAEDSYISFALYKLFRAQLDGKEQLKKLYENCDRPLVRILMHMERDGVMVDQSRLHHLSGIFHKQSDSLQHEIWKLAGREFNIGSPKQLGEILFDHLKLPGGGKNKSTDVGVLTEIADAHPIVQKILEWRSLMKLSGTYTDALPRQIAADGRIHTTYLQTSTNTGRLSSRDPNLQNIPIKTELGAQIRKCFVAAPGHILVSADYSQIQLRLLAHVADVAELKRAFLAGEDIHDATARHIFKIPHGHPVPKELRARAKTTNFSIIYGVSPFGLAAQLDISRDEAKNIIDAYLSGFPEIKDYMERTKEFATAHGYVMTPWGRRIELPDVRNPRMRAYALRAAINAPIQGFEADLMRFAMVKISEKINRDEIKMIMQIHDEIVFECGEAHAEHFAKIIKLDMESVAKLSVPIVADTNISKDWEK
ncbi:MAG: DNA polymerase I [Alphaproteobacteria bacterium]|nr:DNA polymerase I [Alphaproteobacteria bacterium]